MSKKHKNRGRLNKGYSEAGASTKRRALRGFIPSSSSPNEDINLNNLTLRQRSRMLYMAAPLATAAVNTNRTKVVGVGLTVSPTVDRDVLGLSQEQAVTWQRKTLKEFELWASKKINCDALGINNFNAMQQLAMKSWLLSGDVFAVIKRYDPTPLNPYSLRIHLIEADRISTPSEFTNGSFYFGAGGTIPEGKPGEGHKVYDGVEVDENGQVVAYYVCSAYPQQMLLDKAEWTRVLAYGSKTGQPNILQIMESERPDQYRGVPYLAQVIEPLLQMRRYTESELMAAIVQSFFTAWIETETDTSEIPINEVGAGDIPTEAPMEHGISQSESEYEMGPGTVTHLGPGEKIVFGNPNIPTAGFEAFMKSFTKLIGAALEIPYDVLIKEFNSSYSASRGALLEAWEAIKMRRAWFVEDFCQPVYELWLAEAVARGRVKAPGFFDDPLVRAAWSGAKWIGPVQGQLDPLKEANAAVVHIQNGLKTRKQVTTELSGGDWDTNIDILADENKKLKEAFDGLDSASVPGGSGTAGSGWSNWNEE